MRFKKGELTKEALDIILNDLSLLRFKDSKDWEYHYRQVAENIKDIFGRK